MEKDNRTKWLHVRLNENEWDQFHKAFAKAVGIKKSEFARRMLLGKPIVSSYRNSSMDAVMIELSNLRKDLNGIGNNFNQAVHKLHTLDHMPQQRDWYLHWDLERKTITLKIEEIKSKISQMAVQWLQ